MSPTDYGIKYKDRCSSAHWQKDESVRPTKDDQAPNQFYEQVPQYATTVSRISGAKVSDKRLGEANSGCSG
jgi:hypothetical protein